MRYLVKSKSNYYKLRLRIPNSLQNYFKKSEINKSFHTKDFKQAKLLADIIIKKIKHLDQIARVGMIDDDTIQKIVSDFIDQNLNKDYKFRLNKVSFEPSETKNTLKEPLKIENILRDYKNDLSKFDVSKVKTLCEDILEKNKESFDIESPLHRKLALEMLRANVFIYKEMLARNEGNWSYNNIPKLTTNTRILPTIKDSFMEYISRFKNTSQASDKEKTINLIKDVLLPITAYSISNIQEFDEDIIFEIRNLMSIIPKRKGKVASLDLFEWLNTSSNTDDYEK